MHLFHCKIKVKFLETGKKKGGPFHSVVVDWQVDPVSVGYLNQSIAVACDHTAIP